MAKKQGKKWYESKTLWVGILQLVVAVLSYIAGELQTGSALTATGILTVVLRYMTSEPLVK